LEAGQKSLEAGQKSLRDDLTARMDHIQNDMMVRINSQFDRILDSLAAIRQDGDTTKGHVIYALQENLTLSQRISKLEEDMRRPR
jgi:BMFP domain-containing protein YqiC